MAKVWVKVVNIIRYDENGATITKHNGDWAQLSRGQAKDELARGNVKILQPATLQTVQDLTDCAIYLRGAILESQRLNLATRFPGVPIEIYQGYPTAGRFLVWDMRAPLRHDLVLTGFGLLAKWQLAVPLLNYDTLALDVGTELERIATQEIIHDLRVPLYNPAVIFGRRCEETRNLFELWAGGNELAFLRALYQARPIINALPPSWVM